MTIERVQEKDKELLGLYKAALDNRSMGNINEKLKELWEGIRNDEDILSAALKISNPNDTNLINFTAPSIAGLVLIDYKNVDPLAYDVVTKCILSDTHLASRINPLLSEYNISYLITILFNHESKFNDNLQILGQISRQKEINILYGAYYAYLHPNFTKNNLIAYQLYTIGFDNLLQNYEECAKLRRLMKLPYEW